MIGFLVSLALVSPAQAQPTAKDGATLSRQISRCVQSLMRGMEGRNLAIRFQATRDGRIVTDSLRIGERIESPSGTATIPERLKPALARCLERRFGAVASVSGEPLQSYVQPLAIAADRRPDPSMGHFFPQLFMPAVTAMVVSGLAVLVLALRYAATKTVKG